jgi:tripartite-type tricarboxylate transporter receptor subunit TctC
MDKKISRLFIYSVAIFTALTFSSVGMAAPAFPTKPITIICPWAAGGSTDLTVRMLAKRATELLGQPVIVEDKTGGGGFVANAEVYNAAPDGYTLVVNASSTIVLSPHLRKAPFDPWKMTPIMSYVVYPFTLAVKADAPWKTIKEFVEYIRKNPGEVKMSTSGPDAMENLAMFMLKDQEKLDFKLVPYEGGAPAVAAALGGHTNAFIGVAEAIPHIRDGSMRGLATFLSQRMPGLSDIPTLKESGYNVEVESRIAIYGPPGVTKDIVKKLEETFSKAMDSEDFKKVAKTFECTPSFHDSEKIDRYHRDLSAKIKTILIKIGRIKE